MWSSSSEKCNGDNGSVDKALISYQDTNSIPAEERLSICLWFLATGDSYRTIAGSFRAGISTVSMLIPDVVAAIWDCLVEEFMAVPGAEEWRSSDGGIVSNSAFGNDCQTPLRLHSNFRRGKRESRN
uniref:Transposase Helix-turn-helix domain-containing protein n=2 Tax=Knipowitschia caucasica TaxID=637954 RepID=A0AAV2MJ25_KNICA